MTPGQPIEGLKITGTRPVMTELLERPQTEHWLDSPKSPNLRPMLNIAKISP
jgi:hypothetical protein